MQIEDAAIAAVKHFPQERQEIMVAIGGAESNWNPTAEGDRLDSFSPIRQESYREFAFGGYLSFGIWQIFLGVHTPRVRKLSGLSSPGELAAWLMVPDNNARVAAEILQEQGLEAWSTYSNGQYLQRAIEAGYAVEQARKAALSNGRSAIVAVSVRESTVHLDYADGGFDERTITNAFGIGGWWRFELSAPKP